VERSLGLAFTTLTIFAPLAQAAHPQQAIQVEGTASPLEFVATGPDPSAPGGSSGLVFARQVLPARATASVRAQSRMIYLNHDGVILRPGDNNSSRQVSSIVTQPTAIGGWDVDDDTWSDTVACIAQLYAPFDVTVTDEDPGDVPHIEAVIHSRSRPPPARPLTLAAARPTPEHARAHGAGRPSSRGETRLARRSVGSIERQRAAKRRGLGSERGSFHRWLFEGRPG